MLGSTLLINGRHCAPKGKAVARQPTHEREGHGKRHTARLEHLFADVAPPKPRERPRVCHAYLCGVVAEVRVTDWGDEHEAHDSAIVILPEGLHVDCSAVHRLGQAIESTVNGMRILLAACCSPAYRSRASAAKG